MTIVEFYVPVMIFCFVTTITPGPNNIMLMASGLNHGVKNSLPHYFGIITGFPMMVVIIGMGLGSLFIAYPILHPIIKILGIGYLLYLAWKIANTRNAKAGDSLRKPFTYLQAVAFQWVNPKAWVIGIGAISAFTNPSDVGSQVIFIVFAFFISGLTGVGLWLLMGASLKTFLKQPKQLHTFNIVMAVLLVMSVAPMAFSEFSPGTR